jgi:hypothetical protein
MLGVISSIDLRPSSLIPVTISFSRTVVGTNRVSADRLAARGAAIPRRWGLTPHSSNHPLIAVRCLGVQERSPQSNAPRAESQSFENI